MKAGCSVRRSPRKDDAHNRQYDRRHDARRKRFALSQHSSADDNSNICCITCSQADGGVWGRLGPMTSPNASFPSYGMIKAPN